MQRRLPAFMSHSIQSDSLPGDDNNEQRLDLMLFGKDGAERGEGGIWNFQGLEQTMKTINKKYIGFEAILENNLLCLCKCLDVTDFFKV